MIVMKFGGTSVEDAAAIRNAGHLIRERVHRKPLVVVSACAGVTSSLIGIAQLASEGDRAAPGLLRDLSERHLALAEELLDARRPDVSALIRDDAQSVSELCAGLSLLRELTPRTLDHVVAFGERWSSLLLSAWLEENGVRVEWIDARKVMITDDRFTEAQPDFAEVQKRADDFFRPPLMRGTVVVTQGFIGSTPAGLTTTIGRGGSDYSAAAFGAALTAEEIQIWTDVDGILTADPSLLPHAKRIDRMTFKEAAELAYFGARVLHPATILPAIRKNISVRVLNSRRPSAQGTLITAASDPGTNGIVKSIAYKEGITVITIQSTRKLGNHGFLAQVFGVFHRHRKNIDVVATSEVGVSLTVDRPENLETIVGELRDIADVRVENGHAVVCVVGEAIRAARGIPARVFTALDTANVKVELISLGGSEINITFVIREERIGEAVGALHAEFFGEPVVAQDHGSFAVPANV